MKQVTGLILIPLDGAGCIVVWSLEEEETGTPGGGGNPLVRTSFHRTLSHTHWRGSNAGRNGDKRVASSVPLRYLFAVILLERIKSSILQETNRVIVLHNVHFYIIHTSENHQTDL